MLLIYRFYRQMILTAPLVSPSSLIFQAPYSRRTVAPSLRKTAKASAVDIGLFLRSWTGVFQCGMPVWTLSSAVVMQSALWTEKAGSTALLLRNVTIVLFPKRDAVAGTREPVSQSNNPTHIHVYLLQRDELLTKACFSLQVPIFRSRSLGVMQDLRIAKNSVMATGSTLPRNAFPCGSPV